MKLYFILSAFVFIAALTNPEHLYSEFSGIYSDTTLKCPVTGDDISGEHIMFRYIDKDVKFCNEGCVMAYKKEPAKFNDHVKCMPCNDDDGNLNINTTYNGVKYYFCGKGCKGKFEAEPEAYLKKFMKKDLY